MTPTFSTIKTVADVAVVEVFAVVVVFAVEDVVAFVAADAWAEEVVAVGAFEADLSVVEEEEAIIHIIRAIGVKDDRRIVDRRKNHKMKMSISNNVNYYLEKVIYVLF